MGKYYSVEDVVNCVADVLAEEANMRGCKPLHAIYFKERAKGVLENLPTIEVSEEVLPIDHCIMCYKFLKEHIGSEITDNAEEFEKWFERMAWHVQKCNEYDTEIRNAEDAISREYVKGICEDMLNEETLGHMLGYIEQAPNVVPTKKMGRWIKVSGYATPGGDPVWECSECGKGRHVYGIEAPSYQRDVSNQQWVTCPNCGVRME